MASGSVKKCATFYKVSYSVPQELLNYIEGLYVPILLSLLRRKS